MPGLAGSTRRTAIAALPSLSLNLIVHLQHLGPVERAVSVSITAIDDAVIDYRHFLFGHLAIAIFIVTHHSDRRIKLLILSSAILRAVHPRTPARATTISATLTANTILPPGLTGRAKAGFTLRTGRTKTGLTTLTCLPGLI